MLVKIFGILEFSQYLGFGKNFGQKFPNMSILVKMFENIEFGANCWKISNLVKFVEKSRFLSNLSKILDFGQNFQKCRF